MKVSKKVSSTAFKCRGLFWGVFAAGILIFPGDFEIVRFIIGLALVLGGQALRFWAAGYIPKYRTEVIGAPVLVTWGPYKWVRNPLYAGNAIMGLGWSLMVGWGWVIAFVIAFMLLYSMIIIPAEEEFLADKFGAEYAEFKKRVPQQNPIPRGGCPDTSPNQKPFDSKRAREEEIYSIRVNIIVTIVIIVRLFLF